MEKRSKTRLKSDGKRDRKEIEMIPKRGLKEVEEDIKKRCNRDLRRDEKDIEKTTRD